MAYDAEEKVYNMSTQYRRRKDLIVAERPSGELVVLERCRYYPPRLPKPQAVTVLPPPRKPLTITITSTTTITRTTNMEAPLPSTPRSPFGPRCSTSCPRGRRRPMCSTHTADHASPSGASWRGGSCARLLTVSGAACVEGIARSTAATIGNGRLSNSPSL
jgi:hypothetical protein